MFGNVIDKKSPNSTAVISETIRHIPLESSARVIPTNLLSGSSTLATSMLKTFPPALEEVLLVHILLLGFLKLKTKLQMLLFWFFFFNCIPKKFQLTKWRDRRSHDVFSLLEQRARKLTMHFRTGTARRFLWCYNTHLSTSKMSVFVAHLSNTSSPSLIFKRGTLGYIDAYPQAHNLRTQFARWAQVWAHLHSSQGLRTAETNPYQQSPNIHISLPRNPTISPVLHQHLSDTSLNWFRAPSQQETRTFYCWLAFCWLSKLNWPSDASSKSSCQHKGEAGSQDYRCTHSHRPSLLLNQTHSQQFFC